MAAGFIHDKLDLKLLILFIMSRVEGAVDFATLTDLTLRDDGIDYFTFADVVDDLVKSGHLEHADERYTITERGRANGAVMESSLPGVVKARCEKALRAYNAEVRRQAQVTAQVVQGEDGRCQVHMGLCDPTGPLLDLTVPAPSAEQGEKVANRFRERPEELFTAILALLTREPGRDDL